MSFYVIFCFPHQKFNTGEKSAALETSIIIIRVSNFGNGITACNGSSTPIKHAIYKLWWFFTLLFSHHPTYWIMAGFGTCVERKKKKNTLRRASTVSANSNWPSRPYWSWRVKIIRHWLKDSSFLATILWTWRLTFLGFKLQCDKRTATEPWRSTV